MARSTRFVKHRPRAVGVQELVKKRDGYVRLRAKRWHVIEVLAKAEKWTHCVELGVFTGATYFHLLRTCKKMTVTGVDAYSIPEGTLEEEGFTHYNKPDMAQLCRLVTEMAAQYGDRARLIVGDSTESAWLFDDKSVDCVFIDADHRTERVLADIDAWTPKVTKWVMGHDWHWDSVKDAVLQRCDPILFADHVWGFRV